MEENLSCPEGYKLACMRSSGSDKALFLLRAYCFAH